MGVSPKRWLLRWRQPLCLAAAAFKTGSFHTILANLSNLFLTFSYACLIASRYGSLLILYLIALNLPV